MKERNWKKGEKKNEANGKRELKGRKIRLMEKGNCKKEEKKENGKVKKVKKGDE